MIKKRIQTLRDYNKKKVNDLNYEGHFKVIYRG